MSERASAVPPSEGRPPVVAVDPESPEAEPEAIRRAAAVIAAGGLVAFPTETVYGLGANALDPAAVARIFAAKGRPADDPLIVHVLDATALIPLVASVPDVARRLAEAFWPGALTLVLPRSPIVPDAVTAGLDTVAIRAPSHPVARALIRAAGTPIAAPSANPFGRTSPTAAEHVVADLGAAVDLVLDGGPCAIGVESTVVDCTTDPVRVLRHGGVPIEALRSIVPGIVATAGPDGSLQGAIDPSDPDLAARALDGPGPRGVDPSDPVLSVEALDGPGPRGVDPSGPATIERRSPGTHTRHYAPRARLVLVAGPSAAVREALFEAAERLRADNVTVGLLVADEDLDEGVPEGVVVRAIGSLADPAAAARGLFAAMREIDASGATVILARDFGGRGIGQAVRDRLSRAAEGRVVWVRTGRIGEAVEWVVGLARSDR